MAEVEYSDKSVNVEKPSEKRSTVVVYARPGDIVNLGFSVDDGRISFVSSDIVFTFGDGSQVVVASMGSLAFTENPPKMYDAAGTLIDLEEILKRAEQIKVTDALLILTTNDEFTLVELEEEVKEIVSASDAEDEGLGGSPDDGGGPLKVETRGHVAEVFDPLGEVDDYNTLTGLGPASVSDGETNYAFNSEEEYTLPGEIPLPVRKSIEVIYYYGDEASKLDDLVQINGSSAEYYDFISLGGYSEDPLVQVAPVSFDITTNVPVFFNARYEGHQINRNFTIKYKTIVPTEIRISGLPDTVGVSLIDESSATLTEEANIWYLDNIVSYQKVELQMSYAQDTNLNNRSITIEVDYYDGDEGRNDTIEFKQVLSIKPVKSAEDLDSASTTILSSTPPGVNVDIENGGLSDIIVGGSAGNNIRTTGGDDFVFSNVGDDKVYLGLGSDVYFASSGIDFVAGGEGNDVAYYDNNADNAVAIDDPSNYLGDSYGTFTDQGSVDAYIGYLNQASLLAEYGVSLDNDFPDIQDDDVLFFSGGVQVYNEFEEFYLSQGSDRVFINDEFIDTTVNYVFHTGNYENNGIDSLYFSDADYAITVNIADDQVIFGASGEGLITGSSGFDLIEGTAKDDTFNLDISGVKEDSMILIGGAGYDVINGVDASGSGLEFNFVDFTIQRNGVDGGTIVSFDEIEAFYGSDADDIFYGASSSISYTLDGGAGTDILSYEKSYQGVTFNLEDGQIYKTVNFNSIADLESKSHDTFSNFEEIRVSNRGDVFLLSDTGQVSSVVDGLGDDDEIDASYTTGPANFFIGSTNVIDGKNVVGSVSYGSSTLEFIDVEILTATASDDTFQVDLETSEEASFSLDGLEGDDTLTFAGSYNLVKIDFSRNRATTTADDSDTVSVFISFDNVERFIGSDADDVFYLSDEAIASNYYLDGGGNDAGTYDVLSFEKISTSDTLYVSVLDSAITLGGETVSFINFEGVVGTKNDDVFIGGETAFKFDGGAGEDTIDYSSITGPITFDQEGKTVVKDAYSGEDDILANVERIRGTTGDDLFKGSYYGALTVDGYDGEDTLKYEDVKNAMTFNIDDTITVTKGSSTDTVSNFEIIYGGHSTDKFILGDGSIDGGVSTIELHGNANDAINQNELDLTAFSGLNTTVDAFSDGAGLVNSAGVNFELYNFYKIDLSDNDDNITFLAGDSGAYSLTGGASDNDTVDYSAISETNIQINDRGLTVTRASDGKDTLTGFENIIATDGNDFINFSASNEVDVNIDLRDGYDTISFVSFRGESVTFDFGADISIVAVNSSGTPINVTFSGAEVFAGANLVDENIFNLHEEVMGYSATADLPIVISGQAGSSADTIVNFDGFSNGVELDLALGTLTYGGSSLYISFRAVTNFVLTDGDDTIINEINSSSSFDGGAGDDIADYSGLGTMSSITVDIASGEVTKDSNLTVDYYTNVETIVGTERDDSFLIGDSSTGSSTGFSHLDGGAGDDYLSFENSPDAITYDKGVLSAGALSGITATNIENLRGSQNDDTFIITSGESLTQFDGASDTKAVSGVGDTITFEGDGVEYKAQGLSITVADAGITYMFDNVENVDAGDGQQKYYASSAVNIRFDGGAGDDVLTYENILFGVTFDFGSGEVVKDNSGTNVDEFLNVETFYGTQASDVFKISDTFDSGGSVVTLYGGGSTAIDFLDFSNITDAVVDIDLTTEFFGTTYDLHDIEAYQFGEGNDTVNIKDETVGYELYMYGGDDTADYSSLNDNTIAIEITYDIFNSGLIIDKGGISSDSISQIENIIGTVNDDVMNGTADMTNLNFDGSGGSDTVSYAEDQDGIQVQLDDATTTIDKGGKDTNGDVVPDEFSGQDTITNVETLRGSSGNDVFVMSGAGSSSSTMAIDGGSGTDFLSFRKYSTALSGDLSAITVTGYVATGFESIEGTVYDDTVSVTTDGSVDSNNVGFVGGEGNDTITFDSSGSGNWSISVDLYNNTATRSTGGSFTIGSVEVFSLTDQNDSVRLSQEAFDNNYQIDGGAGADTVDFQSLDVADSEVVINADNIAVDGVETIKNFENYVFDVVENLHWNATGVDASEYSIEALGGGLYFDISNIIVSRQTMSFSSSNFTNSVYFSSTIDEFHFSGGNNTFMATNLEDVTVVGSSDTTAVDVLSLEYVTSGVNLVTTSGSSGGAAGTISRNGQVTETFSDINEIILTSYSDSLTLTEFLVTGDKILVDGGAGVDSVAIAAAGGSGVDVDLGSGGGGSGGSSTYEIINVENTSLSDFNDTVYSVVDGDFDLDGKDGIDTIDYTTRDNIIVNLQVSESAGVVQATAQKYDSASSDPSLVMGRDFLSSFEIYQLGEHDDVVSITTTLTQDVEIYGNGGINEFYYLGTDISASGAIDMSVSGTGDFTVGSLSVYNFQEIYLRTIKKINFNLNLDVADGFQLFLSDAADASYTFNFSSSSMIVFDNVDHSFSNDDGMFFLETYVHSLDFGASDVTLKIGIDQTFQNMSFSSSGMIYIELQDSLISSMNLEIDGDSGSPHASLQLNSSYNYEITSVFTMDITTSAKIAIADSAANTAYIITSDPSVLNPNNVNYTFEYGTNMSGLILEDKQNAIMYGAMTLALGNSNIDVTTTGEVNFKFGSDMDSSSYEFRRYNISSGSSFASFNLSADGTSDYVTNSREFEVVINAVSSSGSYTLDIYDVSTGEKDLQFIINNANAFSFSAGSSQDIEIGGDVNNFTLNEGFDFGSGGILNYAVTGAMGTDVVLSYSDGTWSDVLRNNYISFYGDFYFDASSLADDVLTINEEWDTLSRVNVNILGLDGKDIQLDIDQSGVAVVLSIGDDGITLTETGGSSTTFSFDTASVEDIAISTGNLAEIEIYDAFLNNLGNNITIHQENATNIVFSGSSGVEQYYFDISASANGVSLVNSSGSEMNFESDLGVSSITFDNPELIFDLNLVGDQFGDSSGDETLYLEGVGELSSLTLDTGAYIWFTQSDASHSLQVKYNRGEADESVVSVFGALWFRNDLQMDIVLSDEPDELVFSRVAIMSEELSSIDVGDDDLSTEDTVHIDYTIDGTSFLEVKVTSDFTTTLSRRGTGSNPMEIDQFGVINSFTTGLGGTSKNEFIYIFAAIPDAGVGDLEYAVNSVEHLDNTSSQPRAKAEFIDIQDVGAMSITIAIDSSSSKGDYVDTVTDRDGSKSNIIVKNASIFSLSSNMDTGTNNSVSQGDLEHDYVFNNTMSLSALDYSYTFSGSIEVIGNLVIKKDGSGVEQGRDMVVGDINSIRAIYHNSFNIDLSSQAAATTIVMYGDEFAFTDVRATGYSDTLVISNEIYEGFSGSDKYAVFDMAGGDDVLLIDDINNDLYIGNSVSSFRNLDVQNAMSIEEGGKGIFVNSVENISFDTRYADVHIGAYARGFNFVAEENTTVFIESEKMDASFEFINGGVISFEDLDSQSLVFSADNDNYSFNGENLAVEGEFDLVGTKGDDVFEINGDNISDLQSIDGLEGTDTLNISGNIRSASEFSGKVTNISRLVFNDMDTNSIDLSIEDIINIKGNQEELLIDVQDSDFNVNIVGDNSDYSYALVKNGEYMTYSLFDANSKEMGTVMVNDGAGLNEDGIYMQGSTMSDELTITSEELREAVSIDGSDGFDTLEISGSITGMEGVAGKTQNIEKIVISDVEETSANLSIKDAISMTDDKNQLVIDIEDEDFDLNIINDGSDYSYSVKSDGEHDVYTVYSDENQNDEVGQIIVNHNHNNGNHH